jgi:hypothetical protein
MKTNLKQHFPVVLFIATGFTANGQKWLITGNANINAVNFLGTTNNQPVANEIYRILPAQTLASGQYMYSLIIDGRKVDTKNMILTK